MIIKFFFKSQIKIWTSKKKKKMGKLINDIFKRLQHLKSLFTLSIKQLWARREEKSRFEWEMKLNASMLLIVSLWIIWNVLKSINSQFEAKQEKKRWS